MKRILTAITVFSVFAVLTILSSCEKYLEEEQVTALSYGYYETEQGCEALVNACYSGLRLKVGDEWCYALFNYGVDEYMKGYEWSQPYAQPEYNDYNSDLDGHVKVGYPDIGDWWALIWNSIDRCNVAVDKIPKVSDGIGALKDDEGKNMRMGEVRFIRAYQYFTLVQQFGSIPLTLEPSSGLEYEWPRVPVSTVYERILEDLEYAYDHVPEDQTEIGRITRDAARHFWAKVLLTRASYVPDPADDADNYDPGGDPTADLQKAAQLVDEIITGGRHALVPDYTELFREGNEVNDEIICSIQYNDVEGLNESNGSWYKNATHLYWFMQYDFGVPGMERNIEYGRPFRRMFPTDYAINIHDRKIDSRLRKSLLEVYYATVKEEAKIPRWTKEELGFAFVDIAADSSWAIRYGDTVHTGDLKFAYATQIEGEYLNVGDTALVFLLNDENTTLTDRKMIGTGYTIYARYYWSTNADRSLNELVTFDRDNDLLDDGSSQYVAGSSTILTYTWNRNRVPSLIKYWDQTKPGGQQSSWGTRDVFLARLAETYLIGAEIYGRLGDYTKAAEYINVVRRRAAFKDGEDKGPFWMRFDGGTAATATASTENDMLIDASYWDDASHDDEEMYPPGVDSKEERFIHFILNEKCREMLGEMVRWEDLKRTGTLVDRTYAFNNDVRNGGYFQKFHRLRPFPQTHLDAIKVDGKYLSPAEKQAYQNKGYY